MKLSRRKRYWLKWNGPKWSAKSARSARAQMGHGDESTRVCATAFMCRHHGSFPRSARELHRIAGINMEPTK